MTQTQHKPFQHTLPSLIYIFTQTKLSVLGIEQLELEQFEIERLNNKSFTDCSEHSPRIQI